MIIKDIPNKINKIIDEITTVSNSNEIDNFDLALLSLLTRFLVEEEGLSKKSHNWNVLHSLLHLETTNHSNVTILKAIIFYLSESNIYESENLDKIGKYVKEYSDKYWTFTDFGGAKIFKNVTIVSCKLLNPIQLIYGVKAKFKKGKLKRILYIYSNTRLSINSVYNIEISIKKNEINHRIYFLNKYEDVSNYYNYYLSNNTLIEKIKYYFYTTYPINHVDFSHILNLSDNKFHYVLNDPFISSSPIKNIPTVIKKKIFYESWGTIKMEEEKYKLHNKITENNLPFIYNDIISDFTNFKDTYYKPIRLSRGMVTNSWNLSYIKTLIKIFSEFTSIDECLFLGKRSDRTLFYRPAGSGKSYEITNFIKNNPQNEYIIFTPTKKAEEVFNAISSNKNVKISQIAKLEADRRHYNSSKVKFKYGFEKNKIIFFDEISMYSYKQWKIISCLENFKQINFIGDPFQIKPIHESGWSHLIEYISKKYISPSKKDFLKNHRLDVKSDNYKKIMELHSDLREGKINVRNKKYGTLFTSYDGYEDLFSKITNINFSKYTIIVPENDGVLGVNNVNRAVSMLLERDTDFMVGDIVVLTEDKRDIFGKWYPGKKLIISHKVSDDVNEDFFFKNFDKPITVMKSTNKPFSHEKILTGHRSQGQSIDNVLVVITSSSIIDYRWLYTAVSRASKDVHVIYPFDFMFEDLPFKKKINIEMQNNLSDFIDEIK